jgi:hypothetical protein
VTYCNTYHKIDKGNGAEARYDISTESHLHGWPPKLAARYFNMYSNNAYKVYVCLYKKHHRRRDPMPLRECINILTHSLLPQGLERDREDMVPHQVLQRIFLPLLLVKVEVFNLIQIANRLIDHPVLMVLVPYIAVVLEHQFLKLLLELSIINKIQSRARKIEKGLS